jgi:hypothetical protein
MFDIYAHLNKYDKCLHHKAAPTTDEEHKGSIMVWQELLYDILHMGQNK